MVQKERERIYQLKKRGKKNSEIAAMLGRDASTIGRELRRNQHLKSNSIFRTPQLDHWECDNVLYNVYNGHQRALSTVVEQDRTPNEAYEIEMNRLQKRSSRQNTKNFIHRLHL